MQLSAKTINILKNFSTINSSIVLKSGGVISTISPSSTIMAKATIPDEFPGAHGIYQVNRFIGALSMFENPDIEFSSNSATISSGKEFMDYPFCEVSTIKVPPEKEIKLPSVDVEFTLTNKAFQSVMKGLGVLSLPEIAVIGDGTSVFLSAIDSKTGSSGQYRIDVGETDKAFRAIFRAENMKIMDGDYQVQISSKGISKFVGIEATYWIAVEASSTF